MVFRKIIVHPKRFHADETIGVALMRIIFPSMRNIPIVREYPSSYDLDDPQVLIIDCGNSYDVAKSNFDHHQDGRLACACRLLWKEFYPEDTDEQKQIKRVIDSLFFRSVDLHDRGISFGGGNTISSAINAMNYLPDGFEFAVMYAELTLRAFIAKQKEILPVRNFWYSGKSFGASSRLRIFPQYLSVKIRDELVKYASETKRALLLVWPLGEGQYVLQKVHKDQYFPSDKRQISTDGSMASYATKEQAIAHALELAARHFAKKEFWKSKTKAA